MQPMHVVYSSDDTYAQHLGASLYSLLAHNSDTEINVYIIDNGITASNKDKLMQTVNTFPLSRIFWIDFSRWRIKLALNMQWPISLSAYARLFIGSMLPDRVSRCLYLDCDMIVCDRLDALWNTDMQRHVLAAVQDTVSRSTKEAIGICSCEKYFNSGLLLMNLDKWRNSHAEEACLNFIAQRGGSVTHHDQGVLNGVFHEDVLFLPLTYNVMTIHYIMHRGRLLSYFREDSPFYSEKEIEQAKIHPTILHYTPSFTSRPWVKTCHHPRKDMYWDAIAKTPWAGTAPVKDRDKWYVRLINWKYRVIG